MAFKTLGGHGETEQYKFINSGQVLEGHYIDRATISTQNGPAEKFTIKTASGAAIGVLGSKVLNERMDGAKLGSLVRITYLGKKAPKNPKGKPYNDFTVEVDEDNSVAVAGARPSAAQVVQSLKAGA